ncbi:hypothetical protein RSOLAG22IIIB_01044 [Rhizoctonia solani]|uniref:Uncharacterized protein n=1 Tax=Rhizoctonia solani TaxID=456999 RepID=A0A0K6G2C0_9AGAM|nr:hypothetical protein RSOLAG22IIIB_01044 [Rhizoctonia solani]
MPDYGSPSSSVSSLSSNDVVFSSPAIAATRDSELVDLEEDGAVFSWPAIETPSAHAPMQSDRRIRPSQPPPPIAPASLSLSERWRHAIAMREATREDDPSTTLARRIAAREALRQSQSQSNSTSSSEPTYPTARLLSRTTIPVVESEPPADLRRLATTREAERQLHYRDWHRLGLLDPSSSSVAGSDNAGVTPGRLIPTASYARRRARIPSLLDPNGDEEDEVSELSHRLHRRMSSSTVTDSLLNREHPPGARWLEYERRLTRSRIWSSGQSHSDPNGDDDDTPAARTRYWNARPSSATDNLLSLATAERHAQPSPAPTTPPGLGTFDSDIHQAARPEPRTVPTKPDPLPTPLESMILPTPRQRYMAAFKAAHNS